MHPKIILGPPGTGKTTRLLGMVEESLARGVEPEKIGYFSFTKKAAGEAVDRAMKRFGLERERLRYFRTLHSMCFNSLGLSNGDVFEGRKLIEFGHWLGVDLSEMRHSEDGLLLGYTPGDRAIFMENLARVRMMDLETMYNEQHDELPWSFVSRVARGLAAYKERYRLLDYTDMLDRFANSEWTPQLDEMYVDEAQDLSLLQWRVVEKMASTCSKVTIAGDDDQAIYKWAGAAVQHFVDLRGDVEVLGQSWRCPPEVQSLSHEIITRVTNRRPKEWAPRAGEGRVLRVQDFAQVDLSGRDVLILARNEFVLRDLMEPIKADGIIYEYKGHTSVSRPILEAVRTWESIRRGEIVTADEARRAYEYMSSGVGVRRGFKKLEGMAPDLMVSLQFLKDQGGLMREDIWHQALDRIPPVEKAYLLRAREKGESTVAKPRVRLSTIHGAKGGEADHVVILRDVANRTYNEMQQSPEDEARVWYVGVTRAREQVTIVAPQSNMHYEV